MLLCGAIALSGCATTKTDRENVQMTEVVTYKRVDDGTLNVIVQGKPWTSEHYEMEAGSDGTWTVSINVTPSQPELNSREILYQLGPGMKPVSYSEDSTGPSPVKFYIGFMPGKASIRVKQGDAAEALSELEGDFDAVMSEFLLNDPRLGLFSLNGLIARKYVESGQTGPVEYKVLGGQQPLVVNELDNDSIEHEGAELTLRHFTMDATGGRFVQHVWTRADNMRLVKVQIPRALDAANTDYPGAATLRAKRTKKKAAPTAQDKADAAAGGASDASGQAAGDDAANQDGARDASAQ